MYGSESVLCIPILFLLLLLEFPASAHDRWSEQFNECGTINEDYLFNGKLDTAYDEYPWIARLSYTNSRNEGRFLCSGVLFNKRNVLVPAHCIYTNYEIESYTLHFDDCNARGRCSRTPQSYDVAEVAVHPNFTDRNFDNDIAVLTLRQDVRYSAAVKPICLLPTSNNGDYIGQRLELVGFNFFSNIKQKTIAFVTSHSHCSEFLPEEFSLSQNHICGFLPSDIKLNSGAALMGVNVVNGELKSFYLIGLIIYGSTMSERYLPNAFMRISTHRDWILYNSF